MNNYSLLWILFLKSGHSPPHAAQRIDLEQPRLRPLSIRPIYFISILNHILIQHGTPGPVPVFHCYGATAILHVMGRSLPVMHVSPPKHNPILWNKFQKADTGTALRPSAKAHSRHYAAPAARGFPHAAYALQKTRGMPPYGRHAP